MNYIAYLFLWLSLLVGVVALAEDPAVTATAAATPPPSESKLVGLLDVRPSYGPGQGEFHTENAVEAGYQFDKVTKLTYLQAFNTNIYHPTNRSLGLGFEMQDGFFRFRRNLLWQNEDKTTTLSLQARLYTPTFAAKRDAGFLTTLRNYLRLNHNTLGGALDLSIALAPTFHVYSRAGSGNSANPLFDGLVILSADFHLTKSILLTIPLILHHQRYRDFQAGARRNDSWVTNYWIWPELDISLDNTHTIGVAYYSDNLVKEDLSGTQLASGLSKGVFQALWMVSL